MLSISCRTLFFLIACLMLAQNPEPVFAANSPEATAMPAKRPVKKVKKATPAQEYVAQIEPVEMFLGETKVIRRANVARIAIGNGKVISAAATGANEVLVIAESAGQSSLIIWDKAGRQYPLKITVGTNESVRLAHEVADFLGKVKTIKARVLGEKVIIEGDELSDDDRQVLTEVSKSYGNVIDLTGRAGWDRMVVLEVKVIEYSRDAARNVGLDWTTQGRVFGSVSMVGDLFNNNKGKGPVTGTVGIGTENSSVTIPDAVVQPIRIAGSIATGLVPKLNLMLSNGDAVILAEPQLSCRSGSKASYLAGGQIPIAIASATGTPSIEMKDYGIRLNISPVVTRAGAVRALIMSEVSQLDRSVAVMGVPGLLVRKTETEFNVRLGESIVLSGLISHERGEDVASMPLLGSIPVLGSFFRSSNFKNKSTELVVLVTPRLAPSSALEDQAKKVQDKVDKYLNPPPEETVTPAPELDLYR